MASSMIFCGVFRSFSTVGLIQNPINASKTLNTAKVIRNVYTELFISLCFPAPNYWLVSTDAPMPPPIAIMINTVVNEYDAPTAASAFSPTS